MTSLDLHLSGMSDEERLAAAIEASNKDSGSGSEKSDELSDDEKVPSLNLRRPSVRPSIRWIRTACQKKSNLRQQLKLQ